MDLKEMGLQYGSPERKQELKSQDNMQKETRKKNGQRNGKRPVQKKQSEDSEAYVGAPYNFVSLPDQVCPYQDKIPAHNVIDPLKYTGEITYQIEAETPISIDSGIGKDLQDTEENAKKRFYKNKEGKYAIPGSTIRGLVRSNVQILSNSSAADDIEDYRIMYRDVAGGINKERYDTILGNEKDGTKLEKVEAGYLRKEKGAYYIYKTRQELSGERNYYVLNERILINEYLEKRKDWGFSELLSEGRNELQNQPVKFREVKKNGSSHYIGEKNQHYKPHAREISYECHGDRITAIGKKGQLKHDGYVVFSGYIQEKKAFYVIPERDSEQSIKLDEKDIHSFQTDFAGKKKQLGSSSEYFSLPEEEETKPVFYVEAGSTTYFGFTPHLRVFYDQSIYDGVPKEYRTAGLDYAKALFGYSRKQDSYKSRLSFLDAEVQSTRKIFVKKYVWASPKPSSYKDYLKARKGPQAVSYNGDFVIRGLKQYWLRDEVLGERYIKNKNIAKYIPIMEKGSCFQGKIRFKNLSGEELGLVLWGLLLNEESRQNVGKGKPYGFGKIRVKLSGLKVLDCPKAYRLDQLELDPMEDKKEEASKLIEDYKSEMSERLGRDLEKLPHIEEFFLMKRGDVLVPKKKIEYMSVDNGDYRNVRKPLQSVREVFGRDLRESQK